MNRVRVVIATTSGPIEVRRITPEHPDVDSVACIEHEDAELPISSAYNAFVRPPTGIVQRHFEHESYLLELSGRIDVGDSWKLGVFAAHALHYAGQLAAGEDEADEVIWVTGDVQRDLRVSSTGYIEDKLRSSEPVLAELAGRGLPVRLFMPAENAAGLDEERLHKIGVDPEAVRPVAHAGELLEELGLPAPSAKRPAPSANGHAPRGRVRRRLVAIGALAGVVVVAAVAAVVLWRWPAESPTMWGRSAFTTKRLTELMSSIDIQGMSVVTKGPFLMKIRPKGVAAIEVRSRDRKSWLHDTGKWWVDEGTFCYQFRRFGGGQMRCPKIVFENGELAARRNDGTPLNWTFRRISAADRAATDTIPPALEGDGTPSPDDESSRRSADLLVTPFVSNLTSETIASLLASKTVEGTSVVTGTRFVMTLGDSGVATVEMAIRDTSAVMRDQGKWWVENRRFCYRFSRFGFGRRACRHVFEKDGEIKFMFLSGLVVDWQIKSRPTIE